MANKVELLSSWKSDFGDIRFNANLYKNNKLVANIIGSYNLPDYDEKRDKEKLIKEIYTDFDNYVQLPKISKCSRLLQEIYEGVCSSDSEMCHIDENDWNDFYSENYSKQDIEKLQREILRYNLKDVISIDCDGYKIVGYGDLSTRFNDDRQIIKQKEERDDR